jgi:MOSC domain-containing protein YiiM
MRTIARYNRIAIDGMGTFACLGAYARVVRMGEVVVGDPVRLERP